MRASISTLFSVLWKRNKARMLSANLEQTLHRALAGANERRHEYATLEHLLLALIDDPDAMAVLSACSVDLELLRADSLDYVDNELSSLITSPLGATQPTAAFNPVLHRAGIGSESDRATEG